jgi:hypothetical protein
MAYTRVRLNYNIESRIITGMILSTKFLQIIVPLIKLEFFASPYARTVALWCIQFFDTYGHAPQKHIQDIFDDHRRSGTHIEDIELINEFLLILAEHHENLDSDEVFNVEYAVDQAETYFKERALKLLVEQVESNLVSGRILEAHEVVSSFRVADRITAIGCEPFADTSLIEQALTQEDETLFTMPGDLGVMMGPFKREFLVAVAAPMKRYKSASMLDIALQAYYNRLHVAFFSLEMSKNQIIERSTRAITGLPRDGGIYQFPIWDCVNNQNGSCDSRPMGNSVVLVQNPGRDKGWKKTDFPVRGYKPCAKVTCPTLQLTTWLKNKTLKGLDLKEAREYIDSIGKTLGSRFKIVAWPAFSVGLSEIQTCLRSWEYMEGFVPDVIVVDYADILKPYTQFNEERHNLDRTWKGLKALAQTTKTLVVTATQTRRSTLETGDVGQADIAEDIRKLAHVDAMWGISQTPEEKRWGMARIGMLGQRHDEFDVLSQCYILQQLRCGQFCLDSKLKK